MCNTPMEKLHDEFLTVENFKEESNNYLTLANILFTMLFLFLSSMNYSNR